MFSSNTSASQELNANLTDSPSQVAWSSPDGSLLCCSSWDGNVTVWEVCTPKPLVNARTSGIGPATGAADPCPTAINAVPRLQLNLNSPATCCTFIQNRAIAAGTLDKRVMMIDLSANPIQAQQIGLHEGPVKRVFFDSRVNMVCSVSLDKTIKWWDCRNAAPAHSLVLNETPIDADMSSEVLCVLCEDQKLYLWQTSQVNVPPKVVQPERFSLPPVVVRILLDSRGCCLGGAEGRGKIQMFVPNKELDFGFRCHRTESKTGKQNTAANTSSTLLIHTVNDIDVNPCYGSILTAGGDGYWLSWDKDSRSKIGQHKLSGPICCARYHPSGRMLAIGCGYDWSMGANRPSTSNTKNIVIIMAMKDEWIKVKAPK